MSDSFRRTISRLPDIGSTATLNSGFKLEHWLLASLALMISLWLIPEAWRHLKADAIAGPARMYVSRIARPIAPRTDAEWENAMRALERATVLAPDDANAHAELGAFYITNPRPTEATEAGQLQNKGLALSHLGSASHLRPSDPRGWADLARALLIARGPGEQYISAWNLASELGPNEATVQSQLLEMALATYPDSQTPETTEWMKKLYLRADEKKLFAIQRLAGVYSLTFLPTGDLALVSPQAEPPTPPANNP